MPVTPGSSYDPRVIFAALIAAGLVTLAVTTLTVTNQVFTEQAAPAVSNAGTTKLYADSTSHTLQASENTGTFSDVALVGRADTWSALQRTSIGWESIGAAADANTVSQGVFDTSASLQTGYSRTSGAGFVRSVQWGTGWLPLHLHCGAATHANSLSVFSGGSLAFAINTDRCFGASNSSGGVNFGTGAVQVQSWPGPDVGTAAPSTSPADTVQGWADNSAAANCNWFYRNEAGFVQQITGLQKRRATTQTVTDSTTLAADDTLTIPVLQTSAISGHSGAYAFHLVYYFTTTATTAGAKVDMSGPAAGAATFTSFQGDIIYTNLSTFALASGTEMTAANTASGNAAGLGASTKVEATGVFVVSGSGLVGPKFAQFAETGAAESIVAKAGSFLVLTPLP